MLDNPVGDELLLVRTTRPQDLHVHRLRQEAPEQGGLADPGGALDQDQTRLAGTNLIQRRPQQGQLLLPADQRPGRLATPSHLQCPRSHREG